MVLYHAGGASDFEFYGAPPSPDDSDRQIMHNAARLLRARGQARAARILETVPLGIGAAANHLEDEFFAAYARVPLEQYEQLRLGKDTPEGKAVFQQLADALGELGQYVRFVVVELELEPVPPKGANKPDPALRPSEIHKLVYGYVGVSGGYLADFSYRTHREFYVELDLDIDPEEHRGTTRERFTHILSESSPERQARILQGILQRCPVGSSDRRTKERHDEIAGWIARLKGPAGVGEGSPQGSSAPSAAGAPEQGGPIYDVFICHSSGDKDTVRQVAVELRAAGLKVWIDEEQIAPGDAITEKIQQGLVSSSRVIACLSGAFVRSNWCRAEYGPILHDQITRGTGARVIPLVLDMISADDIPVLLRDRRRVDYRNSEDWRHLIAYLVQKRIGEPL